MFLLQGNPIEKQLQFKPSIHAFDQDLGINASLQYSILSGKCLLQNIKIRFRFLIAIIFFKILLLFKMKIRSVDLGNYKFDKFFLNRRSIKFYL